MAKLWTALYSAGQIEDAYAALDVRNFFLYNAYS